MISRAVRDSVSLPQGFAPVALFMLLLAPGFHSRAQDVTWTAPGTGAWTNPANWSGGTKPTMENTAVIDRNGSVTVGENESAAAAFLTAGATAGNATSLQIDGTLITINLTLGRDSGSSGTAQVTADAGLAGLNLIVGEHGTGEMNLNGAASFYFTQVGKGNGSSGVLNVKAGAVMSGSAYTILDILGFGAARDLSSEQLAAEFQAWRNGLSSEEEKIADVYLDAIDFSLNALTSVLDNASLFIGTGNNSSGTLNINGGQVFAMLMTLATGEGSQGLLNVNTGGSLHLGVNTGLSMATGGVLTIGGGMGTAAVLIEQGSLEGTNFTIVQIDGINSSLHVNSGTVIAGSLNLEGTAGTLLINGDSRVELAQSFLIGQDLGTGGSATISGGEVTFGQFGLGRGEVFITGGTVTGRGDAVIGAPMRVIDPPDASAILAISGGAVDFAGRMVIADEGKLLLSGGTLSSTEAFIGVRFHEEATSPGAAIVNGGTWTNAGNILIGLSQDPEVPGTGSLTIRDGGRVITDTLTLGLLENDVATIDIGAFDGSSTGGHLTVNSITFSNDKGRTRFNQTDAFTLGADISGAGSLEQRGSGTTILTGAITHTGGTTVSGGTLQIGDGGNAGGLGGNITNNSSLVFDHSNTLTYDKVISGSGVLTKTGEGLLLLSGDHTYTGDTRISGGNLHISTGGSLTTGSGDFYVGYQGTGSLNVNYGASVVTDQAYLGRFQNDSGTMSLSGSFAAAALVIGYQGTGSLTLGQNGFLSIQSETITLGATASGHGTLNFGGAGLAGSTNAATIRGGAGGGTVHFNHIGGFTLEANLTGNLAVQKTGSGTTILAGTNSHTGNTTITAGTLVIASEGSLSETPRIEVAAGAKLDVSAIPFMLGAMQTLVGNGTVLGDVTIAGTLAPGNSPGLLSFSGALTLESTARIEMELASPGDFDRLSLNGMLTYGGTLSISFLDGYLPQVGDISQLFEGFTSHAGAFDSVLLSAPGITASFDNASGTLEILSVPEPSAAVLLATFLAGMLFPRRRSFRAGETVR